MQKRSLFLFRTAVLALSALTLLLNGFEFSVMVIDARDLLSRDVGTPCLVFHDLLVVKTKETHKYVQIFIYEGGWRLPTERRKTLKPSFR